MNYVVADMAGRVDSPLYGVFWRRRNIAGLPPPGGGGVAEYFIRQPDDPYRGYSIKWYGEAQVAYETFRDIGAAYAVGLVLICLLVVAQSGSYLTPRPTPPPGHQRHERGRSASRERTPGERSRFGGI